MFTKTFVGAVITAVSMLGATAAEAAPPAGTPAAESEARYIVTFSGSTKNSDGAATVRSKGGRVDRTFTHAVNGAVVTMTASEVAALRATGIVKSVEIDGVVKAVDTQSNATWGLDRIDQSALPLSGSYSYVDSGSGVTAYIIDTGIRSSHSQFSGRMVAGFSAINDGRGTEDCNGHGTHVAGTVGGSTHGVAKSVTLVPVRVLDCTGSGTWSGVVAGLDWVAANHVSGPAVANMSLGGGISSTVDAAVQNVINDGVLVAVAAGNSSADACNTSPARVPGAVTVGATSSIDVQASYSNFGICLDLYAPGSSITSAYYTSDTATATMSGTSMASPHVAGVAAVLLGRYPNLTVAEATSTLITNATTGVVTSIGAGSPNRLLYSPPTGFVIGGTTPTPTTTQAPTTTAPTTTTAPSTTAPTTTQAPTTTAAPTTTQAPTTTSAPSTTQAPTTTTAPTSAPDAPTDLVATGGRRSASVVWTLGADGGSPLTGHFVSVYSGSKLVAFTVVSGTATSATVKGLRAGSKYTFTVAAVNDVGVSPQSARSNMVRVR